MSRDRDGMSASDWQELYDSYVYRFKNLEINKYEFERALARLGFNATEIEQEVELHS